MDCQARKAEVTLQLYKYQACLWRLEAKESPVPLPETRLQVAPAAPLAASASSAVGKLSLFLHFPFRCVNIVPTRILHICVFCVAGGLVESAPKSLIKEELERKIREVEISIKVKNLVLKKEFLDKGAQSVIDRQTELLKLIEGQLGREEEKALREEYKMLCRDPLYLAAMDCQARKPEVTVQLCQYQTELWQLEAQENSASLPARPLQAAPTAPLAVSTADSKFFFSSILFLLILFQLEY